VQQIILSLYVISIPAAVIYLQKSFKPAADPTALLGVLPTFACCSGCSKISVILSAAKDLCRTRSFAVCAAQDDGAT